MPEKIRAVSLRLLYLQLSLYVWKCHALGIFKLHTSISVRFFWLWGLRLADSLTSFHRTESVCISCTSTIRERSALVGGGIKVILPDGSPAWSSGRYFVANIFKKRGNGCANLNTVGLWSVRSHFIIYLATVILILPFSFNKYIYTLPLNLLVTGQCDSHSSLVLKLL